MNLSMQVLNAAEGRAECALAFIVAAFKKTEEISVSYLLRIDGQIPGPTALQEGPEVIQKCRCGFGRKAMDVQGSRFRLVDQVHQRQFLLKSLIFKE